MFIDGCMHLCMKVVGRVKDVRERFGRMIGHTTPRDDIVSLTQYNDWFSRNGAVLNSGEVARKSSYVVSGWNCCGP